MKVALKTIPSRTLSRDRVIVLRWNNDSDLAVSNRRRAFKKLRPILLNKMLLNSRDVLLWFGKLLRRQKRNVGGYWSTLCPKTPVKEV